MRKLLTFLIAGLGLLNLNAQTSNRYEENKDNWPERIYDMTIGYETVNYTGKNVKAMTINGGIPGPNLEFEEGEFAVINVTNRMGVETSVHWHGMILPNYFDGVPYSLLKYTVNVAPMQKVVMEFDASEYGEATNIRNQFT